MCCQGAGKRAAAAERRRIRAGKGQSGKRDLTIQCSCVFHWRSQPTSSQTHSTIWPFSSSICCDVMCAAAGKRPTTLWKCRKNRCSARKTFSTFSRTFHLLAPNAKISKTDSSLNGISFVNFVCVSVVYVWPSLLCFYCIRLMNSPSSLNCCCFLRCATPVVYPVKYWHCLCCTVRPFPVPYQPVAQSNSILSKTTPGSYATIWFNIRRQVCIKRCIWYYCNSTAMKKDGGRRLEASNYGSCTRISIPLAHSCTAPVCHLGKHLCHGASFKVETFRFIFCFFFCSGIHPWLYTSLHVSAW